MLMTVYVQSTKYALSVDCTAPTSWLCVSSPLTNHITVDRWHSLQHYCSAGFAQFSVVIAYFQCCDDKRQCKAIYRWHSVVGHQRKSVCATIDRSCRANQLIVHNVFIYRSRCVFDGSDDYFNSLQTVSVFAYIVAGCTLSVFSFQSLNK